MKKTFVFILTAACIAAPVFAVDWAAIQKKEDAYKNQVTQRFSKWIPKGWFIESAAEGDLNQDSIPDVAFIVSDRDYSALQDSDDSINSQIVVLMNEGSHHELFLRSTSYVDGRQNDRYGIPDVEVEIKNGVLHLRVGDGVNKFISTRLFRFEKPGENEYKGRLRLIGSEYVSIEMAGSIFRQTSNNYLTGKCSKTIDFASEGYSDAEKAEMLKEYGMKEGTVWKKIKGNRKIYFGKEDDTTCS